MDGLHSYNHQWYILCLVAEDDRRLLQLYFEVYEQYVQVEQVKLS